MYALHYGSRRRAACRDMGRAEPSGSDNDSCDKQSRDKHPPPASRAWHTPASCNPHTMTKAELTPRSSAAHEHVNTEQQSPPDADATDAAARAGALGGPLGGNRMMVGQPNPFVGKPPHGSDVDNMNPGLHGKMTPMYEKQQQRFGASAKKGGANMFAGGFNQPA